MLKNLMALAGFEPANLGTRGQHANPQTTEAAFSMYLMITVQKHAKIF
jgi:hypothetical protein